MSALGCIDFFSIVGEWEGEWEGEWDPEDEVGTWSWPSCGCWDDPKSPKLAKPKLLLFKGGGAWFEGTVVGRKGLFDWGKGIDVWGIEGDWVKGDKRSILEREEDFVLIGLKEFANSTSSVPVITGRDYFEIWINSKMLSFF